MMKAIFLIFCLIGSSCLLASPSNKVKLFVNAYNEHNIEGMLILVSDDVKWLYNINDELISETDNKLALEKSLQVHFKHRTNARSELKKLLTLGPTVVAIEEAFSNDGEGSQCALSVYQTKNDLITSVTYYAATSCPQD
jgi:hypothetical protein